MNVEFVSANPTGPLHVGNARGAFVGDLLSRVLEAGGQQVTREYYFNDVGGQIPNLGASIAALRRGEAVPEDGYHGDYVGDLAPAVPDDVWAEATAAGADTAGILGHWAAGRVREGIEASLAAPRRPVRRLDDRGERCTSGGWVDRAVERLREGGHVYEQDGAMWFRSTDIRRRQGPRDHPLERRADLLRRRHRLRHREVQPRLRPPDLRLGRRPPRHGRPRPERGGGDGLRPASTSRCCSTHGSASSATASRSRCPSGPATSSPSTSCSSEVGVDAARWFFASRSVNTGIDFDIELAKKQSNENPVYYVQYAHARIASILRKAARRGPGAGDRTSSAGWRSHRRRRSPGRSSASRRSSRTPSRPRRRTGITAYATELATTFHAFYRDARVVDPDAPDRSAARLALAGAARITLANALGLLGISAPESM